MSIVVNGVKKAPQTLTIDTAGTVGAGQWYLVVGDNPARRGMVFQNQGATSLKLVGLSGTAGTIGLDLAAGSSTSDDISRDAWYARTASASTSLYAQEIV